MSSVPRILVSMSPNVGKVHINGPNSAVRTLGICSWCSCLAAKSVSNLFLFYFSLFSITSCRLGAEYGSRRYKNTTSIDAVFLVCSNLSCILSRIEYFSLSPKLNIYIWQCLHRLYQSAMVAREMYSIKSSGVAGHNISLALSNTIPYKICFFELL